MTWVLQGSIFLIGHGGVQAFVVLERSNVAPPSFKTPSTLLYQSTPAVDDHPISDFQQRLLNRMRGSSSAATTTTKIKTENSISRRHVQTSLIQEVVTLKDYKRVVIDESLDDQLVVVWFYSPWCRSCKGVSKGVQALSREYRNDIKFVQVPVLNENAALHQGLGVKSVPFVHVYHPSVGLVEERKLTRKYLPGFHKLLQDYRMGQCSLEQIPNTTTNEDKSSSWSTESPYEPVHKAKDIEEETVLRDGV